MYICVNILVCDNSDRWIGLLVGSIKFPYQISADGYTFCTLPIHAIECEIAYRRNAVSSLRMCSNLTDAVDSMVSECLQTEKAQQRRFEWINYIMLEINERYILIELSFCVGRNGS